MISDFVDDLTEFEMVDILEAIAGYRRDPKNKFFPTPGQIRALAADARKDRNLRSSVDGKPYTPQFGESRPIMWWTLSQRLWQPHWREHEIPSEHRAQYDIIQHKRRTGQTVQ